MKRIESAARAAFVAALAAGLLAAGGCTRDFEPFQELSKLRVLGVKAESPAPDPGESSVLSALIYEPDGDPIEYSWSWCPVTAGAATGFDCAVAEEDLVEIAEGFAPGAGEFVPSYDLGSDPTAVFDYSLPPLLLSGLCQAALSEELPSFVPLPDCEEKLTVSVRLDVSAGGESVTAVKELPLYFDAGDADNENPVVLGMSLAPADEEGASLVDAPADEALLIDAGRRYRVVVDVPLGSAQTFTPAPAEDEPEPAPRRESLFATWFITSGATEFKRTTFFDEEIPIEELSENVWSTPHLADLEGGDVASLFIVVQDERGGVGWISRSFRLAE